MEEFFTLLHQKIVVSSGSGLEPDSTGSVDTDPARKNDPHKKQKVKKFHVLKCWMFPSGD